MAAQWPALAVAHRGDPYVHRENTLASVRSALRKGADAVEVDVRLTRDGVPVLLHDATLKRLWGHPRAVADARPPPSVAELTGGGVPTLARRAGRGCGGRVRADAARPDRRRPGGGRGRGGGPRRAVPRDRVYYCGGAAALRRCAPLDPARRSR